MKSFQMRTCCYSDICPVSLGSFVNISSDVNVKTFVVDLNEMTDCIRILISDIASHYQLKRYILYFITPQKLLRLLDQLPFISNLMKSPRYL